MLPMWLTFIMQRAYLHFVNPDADLFIAGYNVHHLFTGALIEIPAAFVLAIGVRSRLAQRAALVALGVGSAMVLDEVVYLIATDGSNASYLLPVSLWGGVLLMSLATGLLLALRRVRRGRAGSDIS
jgi:hypothetical protein